jgi:PBP1b-binding outer membrane lipoprotein LpoB
MTKYSYILVVLVLIFLILTGCVGPSRLEMDYGTSYKLAKFNQTLNPEAEKNLEPVTGFDGGAAQATVGKYRKGFEEKTSAPVYSINIGGFGK